jgi:hypothetical protein
VDRPTICNEILNLMFERQIAVLKQADRVPVSVLDLTARTVPSVLYRKVFLMRTCMYNVADTYRISGIFSSPVGRRFFLSNSRYRTYLPLIFFCLSLSGNIFSLPPCTLRNKCPVCRLSVFSVFRIRIRIDLVCWIRIHIMNADPDPDLGGQ